jgi:ribosomal protein L7/L12
MKHIKIEDGACSIELSYPAEDILMAKNLVQHLMAAIEYEVSTLKNIVVTGYEGDKIKAIKAVRAVSLMTLKNAKEFVEDAQGGGRPVLCENPSPQKIDEVSAELHKAGVLFRIC